MFLPRKDFLKNTITLTNEVFGSPNKNGKLLLNSGYIEVDVVEELGIQYPWRNTGRFPIKPGKTVRIEFSEISKHISSNRLTFKLSNRSN
ncbi:MAG: hypothetical protein CM1200mP28_09700 [Deltaproteobacteria bacterium]|nr:MAG: hypothetical protein CM1200mP28_09700 [Deltaproteobacteria bacterium]